MHWICWNTGEPFVANLDKFGFVYIITNTKTGKAYGKAYVGCKQYFSMTKKKTKLKWETYMSSSKYLKADIEKIGKKHFKFEVIAEYKNKRSLNYYEAYYQMKLNVLTATMEDSDDTAFYNSYVGGKWYRPIESYTPLTEDHKKKISEAHKGVPKSEEHKSKMCNGLRKVIYQDGRVDIVENLTEYSKKNNLHQPYLSIIETGHKGIIKIEKIKDGKQ